MEEKNILLMARILSMICTPFYLPITGLAALFLFSYMSLLPWQFKLIVLVMAYLFTILLPTVLIHIYRRYQGWTSRELGAKERRMVPYAISILCYFICFYAMNLFNMPTFMSRILVAALLIQVVCALINVWWKISTHTAAMGGLAGALAAFSLLFDFNPVWWLCLIVGLSGMVGSARIILKQHNQAQVYAGFAVGLIGAFFAIL